MVYVVIAVVVIAVIIYAKHTQADDNSSGYSPKDADSKTLPAILAPPDDDVEPSSFDLSSLSQQPPAGWDMLYEEVDIVGEKYRLKNVAQFNQSLLHALKEKRPFGVKLERDPTNPHDPLAVKVLGFWIEHGRQKTIHIGFLPRNMSRGLNHRIGSDTPLFGQLLRIEFEDEHEVNLAINVYIPARTGKTSTPTSPTPS